MKYIFIGKNKSMGFQNGQCYELKTQCTNNGIIIICHELKVRCPYSSVEAFLRNWEPM